MSKINGILCLALLSTLPAAAFAQSDYPDCPGAGGNIGSQAAKRANSRPR